ncbi:MAG TPA: amidase [Longimicrobiaceae bacterium]|nr:amidase [Longimicrobiaceae bacterium]
MNATELLSDRRRFLGYFSSLGLGGTLLPGVLWAQLRAGAEISTETIECAEEIAGLTFTDDQRALMLEDLRENLRSYEAIRAVPLANAAPPAMAFDPLPPGVAPPVLPDGGVRRAAPTVDRPAGDEELAFLPVSRLSELVRTRQVGSEELTRLYLDRLGRYDPLLHAAVTVTEERAIRRARAADAEIARGGYRGPLHGIPWGAKDLLAVAGYPTTWGTDPFRDQVFDEDAEVVKRLDAAGAVLIAKLTLGELAWGDVWFGGQTRNPWSPEQGSSGSSAGPGAATAAGLVGFSIGSETLGSISSPSTRNGVSGLRPTYGRIPRTGAMTLSWSMDKLGPMCRSAEDCALVFDAIHGPDGRDAAMHTVGFRWEPGGSVRELRVGYVPAVFEGDPTTPQSRLDREAFEAVRSLGVQLIPVELPDFPYDPMLIILSAETSAAFDELTRSGGVDRMVRQERSAWPNSFRASRTIPAVEYVNANRVRTLAMAAWHELFQRVDVIVTPTGAPSQLAATNLTGHPALIVPNGFRPDGTPGSITFLAGLFREDRLLAVGHAYQEATGFHRRWPPLDRFLQA